MQISPGDEQCHAGEVITRADADGPFLQISGELFALRKMAVHDCNAVIQRM